MVRMVLRTGCAFVFAMAGIVAAGQSVAGQPDWAGGKGNKGEQNGNRDKHDGHGNKGNSHDRKAEHRDDAREGRGQDRAPARSGQYFGDKHRAAADGYFKEQFQRGHCPPGLAKKNNGCLPPGQAKKWAVGKPLPREVIFYEVPRPVVQQFGPPPAGHRYVRVGDDILLISPRTGVVIDAIRILGSM